MRQMLVIFSILFFVTLPISGEEEYHFVNQSGSTMSFTIKDSGAIKGSYQSALGCGIGKLRPLVGWRNAKAIIFSVTFQECGSITSWVGQSEDLSEIETIWTLVRGNESWDMKLTGISNFKRLKPE